MKQTSYHRVAAAVRWRPRFRSLTRAAARARRRARPGPGSDGLPFAALRVPCDARVPGPVAELASFALLTALRHLQRVRSRSALRARPGTLHFSAAPIRPTQAPPAAWQATAGVFVVCHPTVVSTTRHPGSAGRACEAEPGHKQSSGLFVPGEGPGLCARRGLQGTSSARFGARARSALRQLTRCVCLTTVSAANGGSYATGPRTRAAQGSRSAAKTASVARPALPGCRVAAPRPPAWEWVVSNGPRTDSQGMRAFHTSRVARRAMESLG